MDPHLLLILASVCAGLFLVALLFMISRPATWSALVDRENDFWVRRGWLSRGFVDKIKVLEKGPTLKLMFATVVVLCGIIIWVVLHAPPPPKFRAMPPPPILTQPRQSKH